MPDSLEQSFQSPLLRLPYNLRLKVYLDAGVVCGKNILLGTHLAHIYEYYKYQVFELGSTIALLQTCRTIHAEVFPLLYGSNAFFLDCCRSGLELLHCLTPKMLASLTRLEICLRRTNCSWPRHDCGPRCSQPHSWRVCDSPLHNQPLTGQDSQILEEWHLAAEYIFSHISPYKLAFGLICDTHELEPELCKSLIEPLLICPPLAECKIRLAAERHQHLIDLAQETASVATRRPPQPAFRLLDLPDEIILRVLRYTDLILPWRLIDVWNQDSENHLRYGRNGYWSEEYLCLDAIWQHEYGEHSDWGGRCEEELVCYDWRHSASTPHCYCWRPPTALLLVCQRLSTLSQEVLIQENSMSLEPLRWTAEPQKLKSCQIAHLLTKTLSLRCALQWLANLEVLFTSCRSEGTGAAGSDCVAIWKLEQFYPSEDVQLQARVSSTEWTWGKEELNAVATEGILSFFPGLKQLPGLRRFTIHAVTGFPYIAHSRWLGHQEREGTQLMPQRLENSFQLFISSHLLNGDSESSDLGRRIREMSHWGDRLKRQTLEDVFSRWEETNVDHLY